MTYYSRPTLIQGPKNTLGHPHGLTESSLPLADPGGGHLGPWSLPQRQKWPCLAPQNRKSPRVRSVHTEGALLFRWTSWLEKLVSCYSPPKKVNRNFRRRYSQKKVDQMFISGVFPQKDQQMCALELLRASWRRDPFQLCPPPPLSEILVTCLALANYMNECGAWLIEIEDG